MNCFCLIDHPGGLHPPGWHTYTYKDSDRGDFPTGYNGKTITYDSIGNPLTYGNITYTWEHGRELASLSDGTTTWTYTYDANGMRTSRSNGFSLSNGDNDQLQLSQNAGGLYAHRHIF